MIALADCAVSVSNAQTSAAWWREHLGFEVHSIGTGGHAIMVAPPGDRFVLHLCEGFEPVEPGNSGIAFVTDDIRRLVARMEKGGVRFPEPLQRHAWGESAKFADPDGNVFWLMEATTAFIRAEVGRKAPSAPRRTSASRARSPSPTRSKPRRGGGRR